MLRPGKKVDHEAKISSYRQINGGEATDSNAASRKNRTIFPKFMSLLAICAVFVFVYVDIYDHHYGSAGNASMRNVDSVEKSDSNIVNGVEDVVEADGKTRILDLDAPLLTDDGTLQHLIFSTDCSDFQHWQSYVFFHSALRVKQPGFVTRIASGCTDEEATELVEWHDQHISNVMSDRFLLHLTPHFSGVKDENGNVKGDYKFFNKPFGLKHWMEHGETMGFEDEGRYPDDGSSIRRIKNEDALIILLDPDMILLRPITGDFSVDRDVVIGKRASVNREYKVIHGRPFAQTYGLGVQWQTFNLDHIAGSDSPAKLVSSKDGGTYFPVGPPYLATARDMHAIAVKWTEFVPKVHAEYPHLLAEMYAFCIAAAHLELPHQLIDSLMVSNTGAGGEGWPMVDSIPEENFCANAMKPDHNKFPVPSVIHYCQRYFVGYWFFSKRMMAKDFFTCDKPLLEEPPANILKEVDFGQAPGGERKEMSMIQRKRNGFAVCGVIGALNEAGTFFKNHHCSPGNLEKTYNLAKK